MTSREQIQRVDVVVVGSGAAGMTAALVAARHGLSVLVTEKASTFGGSTARSGGNVWVPVNHVLQAAGVPDSPQLADAYLEHVTAGLVDQARRDALLRNGPPMLAFVQQHSPLRFSWVPGYSDYYPEAPGGLAAGRSIEPSPLDGHLLGPELARLAPPYAGAPGGIPVTAADFRWLSLGRRHPRSLVTLVRVLARWVLSRARGKRLITMGQALAGGLRAGLLAAEVPLWLDAPMTGLLVDRGLPTFDVPAANGEARGDAGGQDDRHGQDGQDGQDRPPSGPDVVAVPDLDGQPADGNQTLPQGRVVGVRVERDGQSVLVYARRGVILACGGFEHDAAMRHRYQQEPIGTAWTVGAASNTGDGIRAGAALGAGLDLMDDAWWGPSIPLPAAPYFCLAERTLPGSLIVNGSGERFVNEASPYVDVVHAMYERHTEASPHIPAWLVTDQRYRDRYLFGTLPPGRRIPQSWYRAGAAHRADSLAELAEAIGVPPATLTATVRRFNGFAGTGDDEDFHRGRSAYDRYYGDPRTRPNPCLAPLSEPPFHAFQLVPGDLGTKGGLRTDQRARVLRADGSVIAGLYAAGNVSAAVMGRSYAGAGATLGPAMTFGYLAALDLCTAPDTAPDAAQPDTAQPDAVQPDAARASAAAAAPAEVAPSPAAAPLVQP